VTLGIPRLVEILMSGARHLATPNMRLILQPPARKPTAQRIADVLSRFVLADAIAALSCQHRLVKSLGGFQRQYTISIRIHDKKVLRGRTTLDAVVNALAKRKSQNFLQRLLTDVAREVKRGRITVAKVGKRNAAADAAADATDDPAEQSSASSRKYHVLSCLFFCVDSSNNIFVLSLISRRKKRSSGMLCAHYYYCT
jgi:hypothetical protein